MELETPTLLELAPPEGWQPIDPSRTGPLPARGALVRVASRILARLGREQVPELFLTLMHTPRLLVPWAWLGSRLMPNGHLVALERERVILRVAWNCRSRYEWLQHVEIGLRVGLSPADIVQVTKGPAAQSTAHLRAMLAAADEFHAQRRVSDDTWAQLSGVLTDALLVELLLVLSHYEGLAGVLNSLAVRPEDEVIHTITAAIEADQTPR